MATLYVIPNWERDFENADSRRIGHVTWFAVQNHFDGKRMRRLLKLKNPAELYGIFHAICAIASKCWYRGVLLDDSGPINALDLSDKTGFSVKNFARALEQLSDPLIGLLERHEIEETDGKWELPEAVKAWAKPRTARQSSRRGGIGDEPAPTGQERAEPAPTSANQAGTGRTSANQRQPVEANKESIPGNNQRQPGRNGQNQRQPASTGQERAEPAPTGRDRAKPVGTEQNRREGVPPTVPQGGQEEILSGGVESRHAGATDLPVGHPLLADVRSLDRSDERAGTSNPKRAAEYSSISSGSSAPPAQNSLDDLGFEEAKSFLGEVFGREKRKWSREEDGLLADVVPISRKDAQMIRCWFRLPADHPIFNERHNPHTQRKQELTTYLRDFCGEGDKMRRFAPFFMLSSEELVEKKQPARWREFFQWKNGEDVMLPSSFWQLGRDHQREYERDFDTFAGATEAAKSSKKSAS